jgi:hypothetical protein
MITIVLVLLIESLTIKVISGLFSCVCQSQLCLDFDN